MSEHSSLASTHKPGGWVESAAERPRTDQHTQMGHRGEFPEAEPTDPNQDVAGQQHWGFVKSVQGAFIRPDTGPRLAASLQTALYSSAPSCGTGSDSRGLGKPRGLHGLLLPLPTALAASGQPPPYSFRNVFVQPHHEKDGFEIQGILNKGTRFQSSSSSRWKRYTC